MTTVFSGDVLIVEDNFIIAMDVEELVTELGASRVHLANKSTDALGIVDSESLCAAILDFHLEDGTSEPVADRLSERGIRFVFATGYSDTSMLPKRYQSHPMLKKPFSREDIMTMFGAMSSE